MKNKTKIAIAMLLIGIYLISLTSALNVESFSVTPDSVAPGKTAAISLLLKNTNENDAEDVSINLDLKDVPFAPYDSGSSYNTDLIETDTSKRIGFEVVALNDAKSGIYKIPVHITYKEDNALKNVDSLISVMINSNPILEINIEDGLLLKGQQNSVSLKIINKGLADVKFLDIELGSSTYYNIISAKKVYIGDVDSNDFQTADFKIFFSANSPNTLNIPVSVVYKDITNKQYTMDSSVNLRVYEQQEAVDVGLIKKSNTIFYVIIVIAVILIFFIYRFIRNRRRRNSEY